MPFTLLEAVSSPGNAAKPNDDAWVAGTTLAVVIDGATSLNDPIMPGASDAAWFAHLAAEYFLIHEHEGDAQAILRATVNDLETQFTKLRSRPPVAMHEMPCGAMMLAKADGNLIDLLWFGDCTAILQQPDGKVVVIGDAVNKRGQEAAQVARIAVDTGVMAASTADRSLFLPSLRASRNRYNTGDSDWIFAPDAHCVDHATQSRQVLNGGTHILLASDGFTALITDYDAYDAPRLIEAAISRGLKSLLGELRAIETEDPSGIKFPRYKRSDDATAMLLKL